MQVQEKEKDKDEDKDKEALDRFGVLGEIPLRR